MSKNTKRRKGDFMKKKVLLKNLKKKDLQLLVFMIAFAFAYIAFDLIVWITSETAVLKGLFIAILLSMWYRKKD